LAIEALGPKAFEAPLSREERQLDAKFLAEFGRQKERVSAMAFRVVEILDDLESYVFEPYAATILQTSYNSWATS
jgi:hypothetical protein